MRPTSVRGVLFLAFTQLITQTSAFRPALFTTRAPLYKSTSTKPFTSSTLMMATTAPSKTEPAKFTTKDYRRPLHWVFKIGSLQKSLQFYEQSFGMHVHRHEEFASGCEATCNGPYGGSWSKTMVGYGREDENFALELTANYGIDEYPLGNDLRYIAIDAKAYKGPASAVETDEKGRKFVASPDGYKYMLVDTGKGEVGKEPFLFVSVHVSDLEKTKKFYVDVLKGNVRKGFPGALGGDEKESVLIGFDKEGTGVCLEIVQLQPKGPTKVNHELASGRFATETEDGAPDIIGAKVKSAGGEILHGPLKLQPHGEEVVIVADPDGYEFCFVDARGYTNCVNVRDAADGTTVDWEYREKLDKAARSGKSAKLEVAKVLAGDYDKARIGKMIDDLVKSNPVVVFAQVTCPFCKKAKELLSEVGAKYKVVEVDALEGKDGFAIRVELDGLTGRSTVPNIFIGGKPVGGFTDGVEELQKKGELVSMLKAAGAM